MGNDVFNVQLGLICCDFDEHFPSMSPVDNDLQSSLSVICLSGFRGRAMLAL